MTTDISPESDIKKILGRVFAAGVSFQRGDYNPPDHLIMSPKEAEKRVAALIQVEVEKAFLKGQLAEMERQRLASRSTGVADQKKLDELLPEVIEEKFQELANLEDKRSPESEAQERKSEA